MLQQDPVGYVTNDPHPGHGFHFRTIIHGLHRPAEGCLGIPLIFPRDLYKEGHLFSKEWQKEERFLEDATFSRILEDTRTWPHDTKHGHLSFRARVSSG